MHLVENTFRRQKLVRLFLVNIFGVFYILPWSKMSWVSWDLAFHRFLGKTNSLLLKFVQVYSFHDLFVYRTNSFESELSTLKRLSFY